MTAVTETPSTAYLVRLRGGVYQATRADLIKMIANVELSLMLKDHDENGGNAAHGLALAYITGEHDDRLGGSRSQLNTHSDSNLLYLWETKYCSLYEELGKSDNLVFHSVLRAAPNGSKITDFMRDATLEIEGRLNGEMIEISQDDLIHRLSALRVAIDDTPPSTKDKFANYRAILADGHLGYRSMGVDELRQRWSENRLSFYRRVENGDIENVPPTDPEFVELVGPDADNRTDTPLF